MVSMSVTREQFFEMFRPGTRVLIDEERGHKWKPARVIDCLWERTVVVCFLLDGLEEAKHNYRYILYSGRKRIELAPD